MTGAALVVRGNALHLPLRDESVDLIFTSPPYFALRSYRDGGEHYTGQIGSEPTPQAFLEVLWAVMAECWRVLRPTGSCFVNLGDKRVADNRGSGTDVKRGLAKFAPAGPQGFVRGFGRPKSKMLLPHRFAIGCEDGMADPEGKGWIMRSDIVWQKLNGLPESVTDRCSDSHEYVFHFTKEGRYFAAVDEVREQYSPNTESFLKMKARWTEDTSGIHVEKEQTKSAGHDGLFRPQINPLGKLPGSVWALASEPLIISEAVKAHYDLPDHFAAFPTELVRRVILGWSPSGVCVQCNEGRRPVVDKRLTANRKGRQTNVLDHPERGVDTQTLGWEQEATITGYACRCGLPAPSTRPAVVLDVFGGTGTTAGVARALGRIGVSADLSHDYSRLADWRIHRSGHFAKVVTRTNRENQGSLL